MGSFIQIAFFVFFVLGTFGYVARELSQFNDKLSRDLVQSVSESIRVVAESK